MKHIFNNLTFDKSANSALAVLNYDALNMLTIENLVADWKRIWIAEVVADEKFAKTM